MSGTSSRAQQPLVWTTTDADNAVKALMDATDRLGITIPSLAREYMSLDFPLVELGKVRPDVAMELAKALTELADFRERSTAPLRTQEDSKGERREEADDE